MAKKATRPKDEPRTRKAGRKPGSAAAVPVTTEPPRVFDPTEVHALLELPAPYDPPRPPPAADGYATFWDPGLSLDELRRRHRALFYLPDALDGEACAKRFERPGWQRLKLLAAGPDRSFAEQAETLDAGAEVPPARVLVAYLVIRALATGERPDVPRLRCRDVLPSGCRVIVGPFHELGLDLGSIADDRASPNVALAAVRPPLSKR